MFCNTPPFDRVHLEIKDFFNSFEKPCGKKHRNNISGDYSIINLQGLRSNSCLDIISRKTPKGKTGDKAYACIKYCLIKNFV